MTEDKDFKRLVRSRMEQTGERYTQARARLRPEAAPAAAEARPPDGPADPGELRRWIVPTDVPSLIDLRDQARRRDFPPWPEASTGFGADPLWELKVLASDPVEEIGAASLPLADVAAMGTAVQGVGYVAFGLDLALPAAEGTTTWPPTPGVTRDVHRAHAALLTWIRERTGYAVPPESAGRVIPGHKFRIQTDEGGGRLVALTETSVMIRPEDEAVIELGAILEGADALPGRAWAGYGVIVTVNRRFPERQVGPGPEGSISVPSPDVGRAFWSAAGAALTAAAHAAHLPPLPLEDAWIRCLTARSGSHGTRYRRRWGHFD